jgi:hypothetical protein
MEARALKSAGVEAIIQKESNGFFGEGKAGKNLTELTTERVVEI